MLYEECITISSILIKGGGVWYRYFVNEIEIGIGMILGVNGYWHLPWRI
jgi:hypothetical protein